MALKFVEYEWLLVQKNTSDGRKSSGGVFFPWSSRQIADDGTITLRSVRHSVRLS